MKCLNASQFLVKNAECALQLSNIIKLRIDMTATQTRRIIVRWGKARTGVQWQWTV